MVTIEKCHSYQVCGPCPQTDKTLKMTVIENKMIQITEISFLIRSANALTVRRKLENNFQA